MAKSPRTSLISDPERAKVVVLRAAIWGMAGSFFGIVFLATLILLRHDTESIWHIPAATAIAASVVSAFYSVKRVGVMGGLVGSLSALGFFIASHDQLPPAWEVVGFGAIAGFLAGIPISKLYDDENRNTLRIAITGAGTGALVGWCCLLLVMLLPQFNYAGVLTLVMVPSVGTIFSYLSFGTDHGRGFTDRLPQWLGVSSVAAVVAGVVATGFWIFAMSIHTGVDLPLRDSVRALMVDIPAAMLGGAFGGAFGGALLEYFGIKWAGRL